MMTSRSEYRLLLRQDNADRRLCPIGHRIGLVSDERMAAVEEKYRAVQQEIDRLTHTGVPEPGAERSAHRRGTSPVTDGCRLIDLLRRPSCLMTILCPLTLLPLPSPGNSGAGGDFRQV